MTATRTGWTACNYSEGDRFDSVTHGAILATFAEAARENELRHYEGVRYVGSDGYLYVDAQEDAE